MVDEYRDLTEFLDDALRLPVAGKTYAIKSPSAADGAAIMALVSGVLKGAVGDVLNDGDERDIYQRCLGDVYDELIEDGVSWVALQHVGQTALTWITAGVDAAASVWAAPSAPGSSPGKAPRAPQDRKPRTRR